MRPMSGDSANEINDDQRLELWRALLQPEHSDLVEAAAAIDAHDAAALMRLRTRWPAELVQVAVELAEARRKAAEKFGEDVAARMVCAVSGIEQATSAAVARHKAQRFAALKPRRIVDLCCGIGGDAMALTQVAPTTAVDRSALRAWMAGRNAGCSTLVADATEADLTDAAVHIDPSRRSEHTGRRWMKYEHYQPGPAFLEQLVRSGHDVAIKLGPGVDIDALPLSDADELEFISECGTLVQAVLWTGRLAQHAGLRTATTLPHGAMFTGEPGLHIATDNFMKYVYTIDPAIERSGLLGAFVNETSLPALHPKVGLLTGGDLVDNPWLTAFEVVQVMPWRVGRVQRWLHEHRGGIVEVKTRGRVVNPDAMQRRLRGGGDRMYTVFVLRFDRSVCAIITNRLGREDQSAPPA